MNKIPFVLSLLFLGTAGCKAPSGSNAHSELMSDTDIQWDGYNVVAKDSLGDHRIVCIPSNESGERDFFSFTASSEALRYNTNEKLKDQFPIWSNKIETFSKTIKDNKLDIYGISKWGPVFRADTADQQGVHLAVDVSKKLSFDKTTFRKRAVIDLMSHAKVYNAEIAQLSISCEAQTEDCLGTEPTVKNLNEAPHLKAICALDYKE